MKQTNPSQEVGTKTSAGQPATFPKPLYMKLSPSTPVYHDIMAIAAELGCQWHEVCREALKLYVKSYRKKA